MKFRRLALLLAASTAAATATAASSASAFVVPTLGVFVDRRGFASPPPSSVAGGVARAGHASVGVSSARRSRLPSSSFSSSFSSSSSPRGRWSARITPSSRLRSSSASDVEGLSSDDASSSSDEDDAPPAAAAAASEETKPPKSAALLEAERLRERARALLSEASAEEELLRSSARSKKSTYDAECDAAISSLIEAAAGGGATTVPPASSGEDDDSSDYDSDVVRRYESTMGESLPQWVKDREAERMRRKGRVKALAGWIGDGRVTTSKLVKVVERIYEREKTARNGRTVAEAAAASERTSRATPSAPKSTGGDGSVAAAAAASNTGPEMPPAAGAAESTFNIGSPSNVAERNASELNRLGGLVDEIIDACEILDEERRTPKRGAGEDEDGDDDDDDAAAVEGGGGGRGGERHYGVSPDSANVLRSRIKDLRRADDENFQRRLASEMHAADRKFKRGKGKGGPTRRIVKGEMREGESIEDFVRRTLGDGGDGDDGSSSAGGAVSTNGTSIEVEILDVTNGGEGIDVADLMMDMMRVPLWIPPSLLPYVITCPDELDPGDAKRIKAEVLKGSTFDCSGWDSFERGAIYRGSFVGRRAARTVAAMEGRGGRGGGMSVQKKEEKTSEISSSASGSTEPQQQQQQQQRSGEVFAEVQSRLVDSGLSERVQLFLLEDPEWRPGDANDETSGEYSGPPPALVALSKNVRPEQAAERGRGVKFLSGLSVAATMLATYAYVVSSYALNPTFFDAIVRENDAFVLTSTIPSFLGVLALQGAHELGHAAVARAKNVTLGLPVPLPSLQIGTFGSITPIRSFPETRTDLMDVALAGPGATAALSLAMMIVGIGATVGSSEEALAAMPVVPAALLRSSFLVGSLVSVLAPKVAALPLSQPVPIHPLFVVGLTGLISSALNLLPIGRLDGGRAYRSAFGRRPAVLTSFLFLLVMAIAALSGSSQLCIFWGLLVTVFQRNGDVPPRDEVTGVDATRRGLYGALTAVALLALLPFPGGPGAL